MILGFSGVGKICCIYILMKVMTDCGEFYKELRMNFKVIIVFQMFGRLDVVINDWIDGIFLILWRRIFRVKKGNFFKIFKLGEGKEERGRFFCD